MRDKALAAIRSHALLRGGDKVVVALSGGADSVALLHFLLSVKDDFNIRIEAAHLNHNLRGTESARDENFVTDLCESLEVPLQLSSLDIAGMAKKAGQSVEECGREQRYAFFERIAGDGRIATAHTLNDRVETFFINLLRGTGLAGLCGIPVSRGKIIRPFIGCTRAEILHYLEEKGLGYMEDSSNLTDNYLRNRIRNHLIPVLEELNEDPYTVFTRLFENLSADEALLSKLTAQLIEQARGPGYYDAGRLAGADPSLAKRALLQIVAGETGHTPEARHIHSLMPMLSGGGRIQLPGGADLRIRQGKMEFLEKYETIGDWRKECCLNRRADTPVGKFFLKEIPDNYNYCNFINKKLLNNTFDYDKIIGKIYLRNRREGDRIRLLGRGCTKTVKKCLSEKKIPPHLRNKVALLADDLGVVWMQGFGVAERCAVDENTRRAVFIETEGERDE